jgi:formyltetrahydrofolate-dependent phosphoribosylglycinamide formyltransferase
MAVGNPLGVRPAVNGRRDRGQNQPVCRAGRGAGSGAQPGDYPEPADPGRSLPKEDPEPVVPPVENPKNVVVLASGSGTLLQALLDAPDPKPFRVAAVGSDRSSCVALDRAAGAGVPTFSCRVADHPDRPAWNAALAAAVATYAPDLIVLAGFMKLLAPTFLDAFDGAFTSKVINAHPSLLPAFPGMHAPADALAHGVKLTGCTVFLVDAGVDAGPIVAQRAVPVADDDDADTLHERIKVVERALLVDVVTALTAAPYTVNGRKVMLG